jgi:cell division control protein 11
MMIWKQLNKKQHSSHLQDLKEITHDFLYENYRTEKLSRTVNGGDQE